MARPTMALGVDEGRRTTSSSLSYPSVDGPPSSSFSRISFGAVGWPLGSLSEVEVGRQPAEIASSHSSMRRKQLSISSATVMAYASVSGTYVYIVPELADCLGVKLSFLVFLLFHSTSFFVSFLLYKLHLALRYPLAECWGDLFAQLYGLRAGFVGWVTLFIALIVWLCNITSQYILLVEQNKPWAIGTPTIFAISALLVLPGSQIRTWRRLLPIAVSCTLAAVVLNVLNSAAIVAGRIEPIITSDDSQSQFVPMKKKWICWLVTPIAFHGQLLFLGIQAEMQEPVRFLRSLQIVYLMHLAFSMAMFGSMLGRLGDANESAYETIRNYFSDRSHLSFAYLTVRFTYLMTSYCIYQRVLARELTVWLFPLGVGEGWKARLCWFGMTAIVLGSISLYMLLFRASWQPYRNAPTVLVDSFAFIFPCLLYLKSRHSLRPFESSRADVFATVVSYGVLISWFLIILGGFDLFGS